MIKGSFYGCSGIKTINCSSSTPWTIDNIYDSCTFFGWNGDGYSDELYETIEVNVPLGSLDAYKSDAEWSKFNNIKEKTSTGIENLNMKENDIQERFDLRGISQRNPTRGLNIVRSKNGTTKKYILK